MLRLRSALLGSRRFVTTAGVVPRSEKQLKAKYDAVIVGGGHNGLVSAAYLAQSGLDVLVLERRHVIGGAAVTEEIVPGFKFSRASYVLSLLRPRIIEDLELKKHGLKWFLRDPNSFTPLRTGGHLLLGRDSSKNKAEIAKFSKKDSEAFGEYEKFIERMGHAIEPLLDQAPLDLRQGTGIFNSQFARSFDALATSLWRLRKDLPEFAELMTAPASKVLDKWFESEPLKMGLATDAVIGAMMSPRSQGSGYVLLHHMMGGVDGMPGAWAYVEGGMGAVSSAIAKSAIAKGVSVVTEAPVASILVDGDKRARGVKLEDGTEIEARYVLSNATHEVTFKKLVSQDLLSEKFKKQVASICYRSPVTKINVALSELPNFKAIPNNADKKPMPHHVGTIHIGCETMDEIHQAYTEAENGSWSQRPVMEMCIPSSLDGTISPPGQHVVTLFIQYTPYELKNGKWDDATRNKFADHVFKLIDEYAPNFSKSVIGRDILTPPDLERIIGLTGGNIFHGSMSFDQLYFLRSTTETSSHSTPIDGLFMCGSSTHPGGGVMGSPGRNTARIVSNIELDRVAKERRAHLLQAQAKRTEILSRDK